MIRKIILTTAALVAALCTFAQVASNINGTWESNTPSKVNLFKVLNGRLVEIATSLTDSQGRFGFRFTPEYEGLYAVGLGSAQYQQAVYRFYFKGNEDLNVKLTKEGYELVGKNSPENKSLFMWDKQTSTFREKGITPGSSTFVDFFPEVEAMKGNLATIKNELKTKNTAFNSLLNDIIDYDFAYYAISYLYMPRTTHPDPEEMSDFYTQFNADKFLTKRLLDLPYGDRFLSVLVMRKVDFKSKPQLDQFVAVIPVNELKGQYILQRFENIRSYSEFQELNEKYKQYFTLPEQEQRAIAVATKLVDTKTGVPAFQFSFTDLEGNKTSLADLKGKVVLLDMWATWCGPCRVEEPHWEKLNDEYKDKAVAFVGISTDQDKPKWEEYIKTKKLKGIQLHAGPGNPLSTAYKVNAIPRYILIDKAGNLITADSPRPSDPKLKELLDIWSKK